MKEGQERVRRIENLFIASLPSRQEQDCHVAPRLEWHKETLRLLKASSDCP